MKVYQVAVAALIASCVHHQASTEAAFIVPATNNNAKSKSVLTNLKHQSYQHHHQRFSATPSLVVVHSLAPSTVETETEEATATATTTTTQQGQSSSTQVDNDFNNSQPKGGEFVNDSIFSWLSMYLDIFGVREGKIIKYGPIPYDVTEDDLSSTTVDERNDILQQAAINLQNIGPRERQRRANASKIATYVSLGYAIFSSLPLFDEGSIQGQLIRFLIVVPLIFAWGYKLSAEEGL